MQDARSLACAARLSLNLGRRERAIELANRSRQIEPATAEALKVLQEASKPAR